MSLINEALKKAQSDRPSSIHAHPAMQGMPMDPQQKPPKKKRYLFSFIIAILVVALLSTLISTYLVYQILGDDDSQPDEVVQSDKVEVIPEQAAPIPDQEPVEPEPVTPGPVAKHTVDEENQATQVEEPQVEVAIEKVEESTPLPEPTPVEVIPEPEPVPVIQEAAPTIAKIDTNPQVWNRLMEFEIRGIMSGGTRVLIFDSRTGKARAYQPGDLVDGALSLKVSSIDQNIINFQNNDGSIFPKSF
jgi:flagellar basal body-associated protein FliL